MPETTVPNDIIVKGDIEIDFAKMGEFITDDRYKIAIAGEAHAITKYNYDPKMFANPALRFYSSESDDPFMVITKNFQIEDIWEGITRADFIEISIDTTNNLFADLERFCLISPTGIDESEQKVTRTIIGLFENTERALKSKDKIMTAMTDMFTNILETSRNEY